MRHEIRVGPIYGLAAIMACATPACELAIFWVACYCGRSHSELLIILAVVAIAANAILAPATSLAPTFFVAFPIVANAALLRKSTS